MEYDIYLWVCPNGHYVGMSSLGKSNPDYTTDKGKKLPRCRCKKTRRLYKVVKMKEVVK